MNLNLARIQSHFNWGCGDFGDLKQEIANLARQSPPGQVASLELGGLEGEQDREFAFLDICSLKAFFYSPQSQDWVGSHEFQRKLDRLKQMPNVDISEVRELKLAVLRLMFCELYQDFWLGNPLYAKDFCLFLSQSKPTFDASISSDFEELFALYCEFVWLQQWQDVKAFAKMNEVLICFAKKE